MLLTTRMKSPKDPKSTTWFFETIRLCSGQRNSIIVPPKLRAVRMNTRPSLIKRAGSSAYTFSIFYDFFGFFWLSARSLTSVDDICPSFNNPTHRLRFKPRVQHSSGLILRQTYTCCFHQPFPYLRQNKLLILRCLRLHVSFLG